MQHEKKIEIEKKRCIKRYTRERIVKKSGNVKINKRSIEP
jgi:hypothetical protein